MDDERYARQSCLPEVGAHGQTRLGAARLGAPVTDGSAFETLYLERAGVGHVETKNGLTAPVFAHAPEFHFKATRSMASGAFRALAQLRQVLGVPTGS